MYDIYVYDECCDGASLINIALSNDVIMSSTFFVQECKRARIIKM